MVPAALKRRPKLRKGDQEYLDAFFALSRSRPVDSMIGACAILHSEILAYILLSGIDGRYERLKYVSLVERLDTDYLKYVSDKAARTRPKT